MPPVKQFRHTVAARLGRELRTTVSHLRQDGIGLHLLHIVAQKVVYRKWHM